MHATVNWKICLHRVYHLVQAAVSVIWNRLSTIQVLLLHYM